MTRCGARARPSASSPRQLIASNILYPKREHLLEARHGGGTQAEKGVRLPGQRLQMLDTLQGRHV